MKIQIALSDMKIKVKPAPDVKKKSVKHRRFAVSDIHGCAKTLVKLLKKIEFSSKDYLIVGGDIINKGPNSKAVVDLLMGMKNCTVLMGNNEHELIDCIYNDKDGTLSAQWAKSKGKATLKSFGVASPKDIPKKYQKWFKGLPIYVKSGNFFVSHAGVDLEKEDPFKSSKKNLKNILWNSKTKADKTGTYRIIVGHAPKTLKEIKKSASTGKIYIDGGCGHGGSLVAYCLEDDSITSVKCKD